MFASKVDSKRALAEYYLLLFLLLKHYNQVDNSIDSLSVIPAGRSRKAISEKLASGMMKALTDELAARYSDRVIIFDCPPILATTGAVALAPHVSQIIMVVEARDTAQSTVREALRVIGEDRVTGALLNKSKNGPSGAEQYYRYAYGYGAAQSAS